jgi:hypothetical protein
MNRNRIYSLPIILSLSGCYGGGVLVIPAETHSHTTTIITHNAPPPFAPAHGYRHHYRDHELQFDTAYGVYLVINSPGLYFYQDHYIRFYNDGWQITSRLQDRWRPARQSDIPSRLNLAIRRDKKRHAVQQLRHDEHNDRHRNEHRNEQRDNHHPKQYADRHETPRHGHRRHYQEQELRFDARIGAYIIVNQPGIYFSDNHYLRLHRGAWQTANKLDGRWRVAERQEVPEKLTKARHAKKDKPVKIDQHGNQYKESWR